MEEVLQIVGSILLLVVGVAVILYVLFRKSPVKNAEPEATEEDANETDGEEDDGEEDDGDDIPEGETPAEIAREKEEPENPDLE